MKAETIDDAPAANVVHLVADHDDLGAAPESVPFGQRITAGAALVLWALLAAAAAGSAVLLTGLWAGDSPGWWFNLIFTVLPALFLFGCALALLESRRSARRERRLSARWEATRANARSTVATIVDRDVRLTEHGSVSSFIVAVRTDDGREVRARWYRSSGSNADRALLQPQVPALGSEVRIWAVPEASVDDPHVVVALDPSVAPRREG
ncbi:hypothetical protein HF576_19965 [Microbacterium sp. CFH 90308]|uniref:Uncharacterized protein n=1 Tax=Microbacterium salsuginis TaxID=2722803 RepID=A0ABX1KGC1_9MICO|nr:hypothetical protein [Microbacterium sp. CFH 90308]NLP86114.1 hypothetical protein [Microbacterium sp. CFH 90308]